MHVLIIDDHPLFREGLKYLLKGLSDQLLISEASAVAEVDEELFLSAELVLLDLTLGRLQNPDGFKKIQEKNVRGAIVVVSSHDGAEIIRECIDNGAAGFIPKTSDPAMLIPALQLILSGGIYLPPEAFDTRSQAAINADSNDGGNTNTEIALTGRQKVALRLACRGLPNKTIAYDMEISEGTVKLHLSSAYKALGVRNRTEAMYKISREGISL